MLNRARILKTFCSFHLYAFSSNIFIVGQTAFCSNEVVPGDVYLQSAWTTSPLRKAQGDIYTTFILYNIKSSSLNPELEVYNQYCLDVSLADFLVIAAEAVIASTRARHEDASPGHRWGHGKIGRNLGGCWFKGGLIVISQCDIIGIYRINMN